MNINKLITYNLEIMTVIFMILYTLHEWEESKFPGGFYRIFFSKCTIDPTISEERLHLPVSVYLLIILIIPFVFDSIAAFALVPLILALFEGFIHTAGITIKEFQTNMKNHMLNRIKGKK